MSSTIEFFGGCMPDARPVTLHAVLTSLPVAGCCTGTTTFRLCVRGLTIFHDAWLERPGAETLLSNHSAKADYVLIHHAHFDHRESMLERLGWGCSAHTHPPPILKSREPTSWPR